MELSVFITYNAFVIIFILIGMIGHRKPQFALFPFMGAIIGFLAFQQLGTDGILIVDTAFSSTNTLLSSCAGSSCNPYPIDLIIIFLALTAVLFSIMIAMKKL